MAVVRCGFPFLVAIFLIFRECGGYLDLSELQGVNYGIDILSTPVVVDDTPLAESVVLTSIYGQQYQCSFPDRKEDEEKKKDEEKVALETGVPELLKQMESSPCLIHTRDWWTYEFCYGKHIKQYHMEDGKISGVVTFLGYFESEFDWDNKTQEMSRNRLNRYHSQLYVNGTVCDITNKPRRAEVRFMCDDGHGDYIARIDEHETCVYVITINTNKLCHHPYLRPPSPRKPVPITCNPLLTLQEYEEYEAELEAKQRAEDEALQAYQEELEAEKKRLEAEKLQLEEDIAAAESQLRQDIDDAETDTDAEETAESGHRDDEELVEETVNVLQRVFSESLAKGLAEVLEQHGYGEEERDDGTLKIFTDSEQLNKHLSEINKDEGDAEDDDEDEDDMQDDEEEEAEVIQKDVTKAKDRFKNEVEKEESILQKLSSQEKNVQNSWHSVDFQKEVVYVETDEHGRERWTAETDNGITRIIEEDDNYGSEKPVMEEKPDEDEDESLLNEFDEELDKLTASKTTKHNIAKYKDTINSDLKAQFDEIVEEAQQEMEKDGVKTTIDKEEAFDKLATTLTKLLARLDQESEEEADGSKTDSSADSIVEKGDTEATVEDTKQEESTDTKDENSRKVKHSTDSEKSGSSPVTDDRVRVRVTKLKKADAVEEEEEEAEEDSVEVEEKSKDGTTSTEPEASLEIPPAQRQKLETRMKTELEKAGMDTMGRKIEVKIITTGYYNSDDKTLHMLSDEESSAFNNMIITILHGNNEAEREMQRQQAMEDNYNFRWQDRSQKKTTKRDILT